MAVKVCKDGKTDRRMEKIQGRKIFDAAMNSLHSGTQFLSEMAMHHIVKLPQFNVRRLAYWVIKRNKKIARECIGWLNKSFGSLGGLSTKTSFA